MRASGSRVQEFRRQNLRRFVNSELWGFKAVWSFLEEPLRTQSLGFWVGIWVLDVGFGSFGF